MLKETKKGVLAKAILKEDRGMTMKQVNGDGMYSYSIRVITLSFSKNVKVTPQYQIGIYIFQL